MIAAKKRNEVFFDDCDVVVVDRFAMSTGNLSCHFVYGELGNHIKALAGDWHFLVKKEPCSVIGFTSCLCCVLQVLLFGSYPVPLQVFELESCLPFFAVTSFVEDNFTTSCMRQRFRFDGDVNFHRAAFVLVQALQFIV